MKNFYNTVLIFSFLAAFGCFNSFAQQGVVTVSQDAEIVKLLRLKKSLEKQNKLTDGYTIQLYYGELPKANEALRKYRAAFSAWPADIEYETPNYKVWVGNYDTRLDADRALLEIQTKFPSAFSLKRTRKKKKEDSNKKSGN